MDLREVLKPVIASAAGLAMTAASGGSAAVEAVRGTPPSILRIRYRLSCEGSSSGARAELELSGHTVLIEFFEGASEAQALLSAREAAMAETSPLRVREQP